MKFVPVLALLSIGAVTVQEPPAPAKPDANHVWLQHLVGEWSVSTEMSAGPDTQPMKVESAESVRSVGGLWVVAEGKFEFLGTPMTTLMTLGYDARKQAFVGTWIDTMQAHMWIYNGSLDAAKKVLTLEAEGPAFDDPTKNAKYRDAIEIVGPDHKVLTSSMLMPDGKWNTFLHADYKRKK